MIYIYDIFQNMLTHINKRHTFFYGGDACFDGLYTPNGQFFIADIPEGLPWEFPPFF